MEFIFLQAMDSAGLINLLFIGGIFLVMYFFMIRPQAKKQKEQASFQNELAKGDDVVTASGILGKVSKIEDEIVTIQVDQKTFMRVTRNAISKEMTESVHSKANVKA